MRSILVLPLISALKCVFLFIGFKIISLDNFIAGCLKIHPKITAQIAVTAIF